ncbi:MAG: mechanosensitive ion channel domain-containing protein [Myxococcota bacterium]
MDLLEAARTLASRLDPYLASSGAKTLLLIVLLGLGRWFLSRTLDRHPELGTLEDRRRWKITARNVAFILLFSGIVLIWARELESLMLSVVALGAALVIAFKEVISCVSGALVRTTTRSFGVGDRIEIAGYRGDVIDHTLLTTTLMEVGPGQRTHQFTGRSVVLPNSLFLSTPVINETFTDDYLVHTFVVAIPRAEDWKRAERALLDAAAEACREYLDTARAFLDEQARRRSLDAISVEPRVWLRLEDPGKTELVVRIAVPARQKGRLEQVILRRFLEETAR